MTHLICVFVNFNYIRISSPALHHCNGFYGFIVHVFCLNAKREFVPVASFAEFINSHIKILDDPPIFMI